eukprot:754832_1
MPSFKCKRYIPWKSGFRSLYLPLLWISVMVVFAIYFLHSFNARDHLYQHQLLDMRIKRAQIRLKAAQKINFNLHRVGSLLKEPDAPKAPAGDIRLALACMTRHTSPEELEFWIEYHLQTGFEMIFLRVQDTPEVTYILEQPKYRGIVHAVWLPAWEKIPQKFKEYKDKHNKTVIKSKRYFQAGFIDHVCRVATGLGLNWLFHIDDDELFMYSGKTDLKSYLKSVPDHIHDVHWPNAENILEESNP